MPGNGEYGLMPSAEYDGDRPRSFVNSTPSNPEGAPVTPNGGRNPTQISAAAIHRLLLYSAARRGGGGGRRDRLTPFTEISTMLVIGLVLSVSGLGFLCWLLFTLAVYALPFFAGLTAGTRPPSTAARASSARLLSAFSAAARPWRSGGSPLPRCERR